MHVRVGCDPALMPPIQPALKFQTQFALPRAYRDTRAQRPVLEALDDLYVDVADRDLDGKGAVDIGVRCLPELQIRPVVLEPAVVHLVPVPIRREVTRERRA